MNNLEKENQEKVKQLTEENLLQRQVIEQLKTYVLNLQQNNTDLQLDISNLQQTLTQYDMNNLQQNVANNTHMQQTLTHDINNLQQKVANITHIQQTLTQNMANLQPSLTNNENIQHTEKGVFNCQDGVLYNKDTSTLTYDYSGTFRQAYAKPPTVQFSVPYYLGSGSYQVYLTSVTTTGFTFRCVALINTGGHYLPVRWNSTP